MEFVLDRPFVREFNDRTKSKRPPREALTPTSRGSFLSRLVLLPALANNARRASGRPVGASLARDLRICTETLPVLAFWGD